MNAILYAGAVCVAALALACLVWAIIRALHPRREPDRALELDYSHLDLKTRVLCEANGVLLKARIRQRVTQSELARRMQTSWSAVSRHEHGQTPTLDWICDEARALGLELEITIKEGE